KRGCVDCKKELAQILIDYLAPIHQARKELEKDHALLDRIMANGAGRARQVASATLLEAKKAIGLS
ncbi:MAG TPA: hypothetical protein VMT55_05245, partial [Candidatus Sulfotelmatobacter sp.]|nr:hypothetical protein [Candidatus Sulfotelmatobacter sp.]